jgi:hypothetical protein
MATNSLGFGSLASVAWTDMNGTGLTSAQLAEVNTDILTANDIADDLIKVIKNAVKGEYTSFSLFQAYARNSPVEAAFISEITGEDISDRRQLSLNQWRAVAAQLQDHASQQASRRSPSGEGGGIKTVNGNWYINGQQLSLLDAYMAVRVNQVANFDDSLNIYIAELNANNRLVKAANDWLNTLRTRKTTASLVTGNDRINFSSKWGYDPVATFHSSDKPAGGVNVDLPSSTETKKVDGYIDNVRGYVDAKDSSNQTVQQKLEQMTNRRSEVLDGLTSFAKAQTQTGSSFARNLG